MADIGPFISLPPYMIKPGEPCPICAIEFKPVQIGNAKVHICSGKPVPRARLADMGNKLEVCHTINGRRVVKSYPTEKPPEGG